MVFKACSGLTRLVDRLRMCRMSESCSEVLAGASGELKLSGEFFETSSVGDAQRIPAIRGLLIDSLPIGIYAVLGMTYRGPAEFIGMRARNLKRHLDPWLHPGWTAAGADCRIPGRMCIDGERTVPCR